uniref:UPF0696 protein C11orf68 homolog isoform X2 n=1 Tax=Myxine glutinosa TaxID=7769 RepID=UPI00358E38BD
MPHRAKSFTMDCERAVKKIDKMTAEKCAALMAALMDPPWLEFDSRDTPHSELQPWLEAHRPSSVFRYGDPDQGLEPVGSIVVYGSKTDDQEPGDSADVDGLQDSWEKLQQAGVPLTFSVIKRLALDYEYLPGSWLIFLDSGFKVDHAWACISRAVVDGRLRSAKVSPSVKGSDQKHVMCIYSQDFTNEEDVFAVDGAIRAAGIKCPMLYKPDVYTYLRIYRRNQWGLCPTIYESKFDLQCTPWCSRIIRRFEE